MDKRPKLRINPQDNVASAAAVSAVRPALGHILGPVQVHAPSSSVPAGAEDLNVVYEIGFCHNSAKIAILHLIMEVDIA
jgi:hypothetical protein